MYFTVELAVSAYDIRTIHICRLWVHIPLCHWGVQSLEDWQHGPGRSGTLFKEPYGVGSPTVTLLFRLSAHLYAVTYITEISLNVTLSNQLNNPHSYKYQLQCTCYELQVHLFRDRLQWLNESQWKSIGGVVYRFAFEVVWCKKHHLRGYFESNKLIYIF